MFDKNHNQLYDYMILVSGTLHLQFMKMVNVNTNAILQNEQQKY